MKEIWETVSFRISSSELKATEITDLLGHIPSQSFERGELMSPRNPKSQTRDLSVWILESGLDSSEVLKRHLMILLEFIEKKEHQLSDLKGKCEFDIICGYSLKSQGSIVFDSEIIKRLSILPLNIIFDLYAEA